MRLGNSVRTGSPLFYNSLHNSLPYFQGNVKHDGQGMRVLQQDEREIDSMRDMDNVIRKHIVCHGWVQGVGFRYRARQAAEAFGATGWVRNEPDGSVAMEIQGTEEQIDKIIIAIERGTYVRIEHMDIRKMPVEEEERGFRIQGWC